MKLTIDDKARLKRCVSSLENSNSLDALTHLVKLQFRAANFVHSYYIEECESDDFSAIVDNLLLSILKVSAFYHLDTTRWSEIDSASSLELESQLQNIPHYVSKIFDAKRTLNIWVMGDYVENLIVCLEELLKAKKLSLRDNLRNILQNY